ncbi:MAG: glycosyltransferase [Gammaproteobacteria bacterium]|nr:glycosyltransferase [Gammaproteobacteria bacterium]
MRIALLIRALTVGGAERQLVALARGLLAGGHEVTVLVFYRAGTFLEDELANGGVPVIDLGKRGRWSLVGFIRRLLAAVRTGEFDVVYSFLPTSNVLAAVLWGRSSRPAVIWGVRGGPARTPDGDWLGRWLVAAQRWLVGGASAVIANSAPAVDGLVARGWPPGRLRLVQNGLDDSTFRFDGPARDRLRARWAAGPEVRVLGFAGRLDPVKGIECLLDALVIAGGEGGDLRLVLAGDGSPGYVARLRDYVHSLGVAARVSWLGVQSDMPGFYSAIDVLCLPSRSEGCSNVVAEALACGTPVVATRVGDNGAYVPDELLAIPGNAADLARGIRVALAAVSADARGVRRAAILRQLAMPEMVRRTEAVLSAAVARERAGSRGR